MSPLAEQLRDIRGLDPMPGWPPAAGWWLVAFIILLIAVFAFAKRRRRTVTDWRPEARTLLESLHRRATAGDGRAAASGLSELLRRIAMARHGRRACAGLSGDAWLAWLEAHDPNAFPWRERGRALVDFPFSPPGSQVPPETLKPLIEAAERWLETGAGDEPRAATHSAIRRAHADFLKKLSRRLPARV